MKGAAEGGGGEGRGAGARGGPGVASAPRAPCRSLGAVPGGPRCGGPRGRCFVLSRTPTGRIRKGEVFIHTSGGPQRVQSQQWTREGAGELGVGGWGDQRARERAQRQRAPESMRDRHRTRGRKRVQEKYARDPQTGRRRERPRNRWSRRECGRVPQRKAWKSGGHREGRGEKRAVVTVQGEHPHLVGPEQPCGCPCSVWGAVSPGDPSEEGLQTQCWEKPHPCSLLLPPWPLPSSSPLAGSPLDTDKGAQVGGLCQLGGGSSAGSSGLDHSLGMKLTRGSGTSHVGWRPLAHPFYLHQGLGPWSFLGEGLVCRARGGGFPRVAGAGTSHRDISHRPLA